MVIKDYEEYFETTNNKQLLKRNRNHLISPPEIAIVNAFNMS